MPKTTTNIEILNKGTKIGRIKKKQKKERLQEIKWDDSQRRDYLTGFHKRKMERKKKAEQRAKEKQRQEKLQLRREKREALQQKLTEHLEGHDPQEDLQADIEEEGEGGRNLEVDRRITEKILVKNEYRTTVTTEEL